MKKRFVDIGIVILIITVGIFIRIPLAHLSTVDTSHLFDPDSYFYLRRATEFVNSSISEWTIYSLRSEDPLMSSIDSNNDNPTTNLLPIVAALVCKAFKSLSILDVAYYCCAVISSLTAIPTYIFAKKHTNRAGAIITALLYSTAFSYLAHTTSGFFDTDAIIMLFATILILCQIELLCEKRLSYQLALATIQIVSLIVFSFAWDMYYVYVLIAFAIDFVCILLTRKRINKKDLIVPLSVDTFMLIYSISSKDVLASFVKLFKSTLYKSNWPDESKYIGELASPKFFGGNINTAFFCAKTGFVNWFGGISLFLLFVFAFFFAVRLIINVLRKSTNSLENVSTEQLIVLVSAVLWTSVTIPIVPLGVRFIQLIALPAYLLMGIVFGIYYPSVKSINFVYTKYLFALLISFNIVGALFAINIYVAVIASVLVLTILIFFDIDNYKILFTSLVLTAIMCPVVCGIKLSNASSTYITEDYDNASEYIVSNTNKDSSFVCWWNNGYYFQYSTNRKIVSDGGIYNGSYFYWLSNVFTSDDEKLSAGICKMLSSGGLEAFRIVNTYINDECESTNVLKKILVQSKEDAFDTLTNEYSFEESIADNVLKYTHSAEDVYLIFENSDYEIAKPIAYYGLWDIKKRSGPEFDVTKNSDGTYNFPDELGGSLMLDIYQEKELSMFKEVYSNDSIIVFKVVT